VINDSYLEIPETPKGFNKPEPNSFKKSACHPFLRTGAIDSKPNIFISLSLKAAPVPKFNDINIKY
jgi:hypothetical protein